MLEALKEEIDRPIDKAPNTVTEAKKGRDIITMALSKERPKFIDAKIAKVRTHKSAQELPKDQETTWQHDLA